MPTLEIITIGTELLLGEIQDTNSTYIARTLRDHGIDIYRITTIGDNAQRIASAIREALGRADIIITTGGLGPTVDDPTRQAVADAAGQELIFLPTLWDQILDRFKAHGRIPSDNNRRQAYIPKNGIPIHNPVGTAPCFIVEIGDGCVASLPGVPSEMKVVLDQSIIPYLIRKFNLQSQIIKATVLHAASMGESAIDEAIGDLEKLSNPTVGLLAHPGQVDIRVTAKATSEAEAIELSKPVVKDLLQRLGDNIYGQDEQTLEGIIAKTLNERENSLVVLESGLGGSLIARINSAQPQHFKGTLLSVHPTGLSGLIEQVQSHKTLSQCDLCLGVTVTVDEVVTMHCVYSDTNSLESITRTYGGPPDHAPLWAQNIGLDFLRRQYLSSPK